MQQAGTAFVQIVPSFRGFHRTVGREVRRNIPTQDSEAVGQSIGRSVVSGMTRGLRSVGGVLRTTTTSAARQFVTLTRAAGEFAAGTIRDASRMQNALKGIAPAIDPGWRAVRTFTTAFRGAAQATSGLHSRIDQLGRLSSRAISPLTSSVRGLSHGLQGVYSDAGGLAGRFNTVGLAANVAFGAGRDGARLLSAGMRGVGVSASESNSRMYRIGQTLGTVGQAGTRAWETVHTAASTATSGISSALSRMAAGGQDAVGGVSAALSQMGAIGAAAVAAIGFGQLAATAATAALEIQQTAASMAGLYGETAAANDMMRRLREYAHNTPLETQSLYQAGQNLAYLGLQGEDAMGVIRNVGTALMASGNTSSQAMGNVTSALLSMQSAGQLYAADIQRVSDEMVPAWDLLSAHMGMSIAEVRKEVTAGKLTVEDFIAALQAGEGDYFAMMRESAEQTNQTFRAQFVQIKDNLITTLGETLVPLVDRAAPLLGELGERMDEALRAIPDLLSRIRTELDSAGIINGFQRFVQGALEFSAAALPALQSFATTLGVAIAGVLIVLGPVGDLLQNMAGWMRDNEELVRVLGAALAGATAAIIAIRVATTAWAVAQWAVAAAVNAMGIPLLIVAIAALVAGIVYAYKNFEGFRNVVDTAVSAVVGAAMWLWEVAQPIFSAIGDAAMWLWQNALQPAFDGIVAAIGWVRENLWVLLALGPVAWAIGLAVAIVKNFDRIKAAFGIAADAAMWLWDGLVAGFQAIGAAASWLWSNAIKPAFDFIAAAAKILFAVVSVVLIAPLVIAFNVLSSAAFWLWGHAIQPAFQAIAALAFWLWQNALQPAWVGIQAGISLLGQAFTWLWKNAVRPSWNFIARIVSQAWATLRTIFSAIRSFVRAVLAATFTWFRDNVIRPVWSGVRSLISSAWLSIRAIFGAIRSFVSRTLGPIFTWLRDNVIRPVWSGIRSTISAVWNSGIKPVFSALRSGVDRVKRSFEIARNGIRTAWNQLRSITRKPVKFIVDTVYNDGIRKVWNAVAGLVNMDTLPRYSFATGGITPGYTPGRDVHQYWSPTGGGLELSGGEAIMRPEWTRAVGADFVNSMNAAARRGGAAAVRAAMGFARGGIIPVQRFNRGGLFSRVTDFASSVGDIFTGGALRNAAKRVLDPIMETMSGQFSDSRWGRALTAVPRTMINRLVNWLRDTIGPKLGGDAKKVVEVAESYVGLSGNPNQFTRAFGMNGLPWCAMFVSEVIREAKAAKAYDNIRSAAVARFANSSLRGVYSLANARMGDLAVYRGSGPGGWGHINIYAGDGVTIGGNESNSVRRQSGYAARAAKFMRPSFARGGVFEMRQILGQDQRENRASTTPMLTAALRGAMGMRMYDRGGWLMPGAQAIVNATGRPEAVLTPAQSEALVRIAQRGYGRGGHTFNIHETRNARATARDTVNALRDYETLHPDR